MKLIIYITLLLFINNIYLINCYNICNVWLDSSSTNKTSPCGSSIISPCQNLEASVKTCGNEFDEINFNFFSSSDNNLPFQVDKVGILNSLGNNKTINFINLNQSSIIMDMTLLSTSFIDISNSFNSSNNYFSTINISGFTFSNFKNVSSLINIFNTFVNITISNCNFINTTTSVTFASDLIGYSNYNTNFDNNINNNFLIILNSTFENILSNGKNSLTLLKLTQINVIIDNCIFSNISSRSLGQSILDLESATSIKLTNTKILNCNNLDQTGRIKIDLSMQTNETATAAASAAIWSKPEFVFENITFSDNNNGNGILLWLGRYYNVVFNNFKSINGFNFTPLYMLNVIPIGGAASGNNGDYNHVLITNSIFHNNSNTFNYSPFDYSSNSCAGVTIINSNVTISNSTFTSNTALNGASIYTSEYEPLLIQPTPIYFTVSINNCSFNNNIALYNGGSIFMASVNSISIINSTFNNNTASSNGGSQIYCSTTKVIIQDTIITSSNHDENNKEIYCKSPDSCSFIGSDQDFINVCAAKDTSSSSSNQNSSGGDKDKGISIGQKIGISLIAIAGFFIIVIVTIMVSRKIKMKNRYNPI